MEELEILDEKAFSGHETDPYCYTANQKIVDCVGMFVVIGLLILVISTLFLNVIDVIIN